MTQAEAIKILQKKKKWMETSEIAKIIGTSRGTAATNLFKLLKQQEVIRRIKKRRTFEYKLR